MTTESIVTRNNIKYREIRDGLNYSSERITPLTKAETDALIETNNNLDLSHVEYEAYETRNAVKGTDGQPDGGTGYIYD